MKLTLAKPEHAEHIARFYQSLHGEEFPHPEMFEARTVAQLVRDEELALVLATDGARVIGAAMGFPQSWNQVLEIGPLSVDEIPDRSDVAKALFEAMRRYGLKQFGVTFFRARSEAAFRRGREIGATCWGYRPSPGARNIEEFELLMGFYEEQNTVPRIAPPLNAITALPFCKRIIDSLEAQTSDVPYPKQYPVGAPRGTGSPVISGRIWPTYHSAKNYITIESSAGPFPTDIIREFVGKVRQKGVTDIRMSLPANHAEAYGDLLDFGFKPVAYLPGWHIRGPHRFDCVEMVAGAPRIPRQRESFMERAVGKVADGLKA
jgi:predicted N-acetyltransferase YhbS